MKAFSSIFHKILAIVIVAMVFVLFITSLLPKKDEIKHNSFGYNLQKTKLENSKLREKLKLELKQELEESKLSEEELKAKRLKEDYKKSIEQKKEH